MRQIEFRGKTFDEQWVYGDLFLDFDYEMYRIRYVQDFLVQDDTIGQYTGRKDKDGVKIYDGDIISIGNDSTSNKPILDLVEYKEDRMAFCICPVEYVAHPVKFMDYFFSPSDRWWHSFGKDIKVVGNRWDNPELLK